MKNMFRLIRGFFAFVTLVRDPRRLDSVIDLVTEVSDPIVLDEFAHDFALTSYGKKALLEKPRLPKLDLEQLRHLPKGTLGHEFAEHMIANNLNPEDLPNLPSRTEHEYVLAHSY